MGGVANRHAVYWSFLPSDKHILSWKGIVFNVQFKSGDSVSGIQHFVAPVLVDTPKIPFELIIDLPKPRYERNIVQRDSLGRIIHSKVPSSLV